MRRLAETLDAQNAREYMRLGRAARAIGFFQDANDFFRDANRLAPEDPATEIGPLVAKRQQQRVRGYIEDGRRRITSYNVCYTKLLREIGEVQGCRPRSTDAG